MRGGGGEGGERAHDAEVDQAREELQRILEAGTAFTAIAGSARHAESDDA